MRYIIIFTILISPQLFLAQCISTSATTVCGMENIDFEVNNPADSITYFWDFGGGSLGETGAVVNHSFPAGSSDVNYTVTVTSSDSSCQETLNIEVLSAPDASIIDAEGDTKFVNCIENSGNTIYNLIIENASTTLTTNTNYNIDWGDGSSIVNTNNFTTLSHDYAQGYYELTLTVTGDGSLNCNTTTYIYQVFNGSNPAISVQNFGANNFYCSVIYTEFGIASFVNNPPETLYSVYLNGVLDTIYAHPPPDTIGFLFEASSCGLPNDEYEIRVVAANPCGATPASTAIGISDPPTLTVSDANSAACEDVPYVVSIAAIIDIYEYDSQLGIGTCLPDPNGSVTWSITPQIGWDTLSLSPLTVTFDQSGVYVLEVTAENKCDSITTTDTIQVFPFPDSLNVLVDFDSSSVLSCLPLQGAFQNLSNGQSSALADSMSFEWAVSSPTGCWEVINETPDNLDIEFLCDGDYTISLTGTNICTTVSWDTTFAVYDIPTINLDIPDTLCLPLVVGEYVNFEANGTAITYTECTVYDTNYVELGTCDSLSTSLVIGDYIVKVSVFNDCGFSVAEDTFYIFTEYIDIDIEEIPPVCPGTDIALLVNPVGGVWTINDDTVTMPYTMSQTSELVYTYQFSGCTFTESTQVEVLNTIEVDAGGDFWYCVDTAPLNTVLSGTPSGGTWSNDGITDDGLITADSAGIYVFTYTVYDSITNCWPADSIFYTLEEIVAAIDMPTQVCVGDTVIFNSISSISPANMDVAYEWNLGYPASISTASSTQFVYEQAGIYTISLSLTGTLCTEVITADLLVVENPIADFSISSNPCDTIVCFENNSTGGGLTYSWDFGNGEVSDTISPNCITFQPEETDTTYLVSLTVSNECGNSTFTEYITIYSELEANINTETEVCSKIAFDLIGSQSTGYIEGYEWIFDGVPFSSATDTAFTLPVVEEETDFEITLIVSNACASDTSTQTITVIPPFVEAAFAYLPGDTIICQYDTIQFFNQSTGDTLLNWNFGDGYFAAENPIYVFNEPGEITVSLWAWGCTSDLISQTFYVQPAPEACFNYTTPCLGDETCLTICNAPAGEYSYSWLVNGEPYFDFEPCIMFADTGNYEVILTVNDPLHGCVATYTDYIEVLPVPLADFSWEKDNCTLSISLKEQSEGAQFFSWYYDDGNTDIGAIAQHSFNTDGLHSVTMIAENQYGCLDSTSQQMNYNPVPTSQFVYELEENCEIPANVYFTNTSINAVAYEWSFGNGQGSFQSNPSTSYEERDSYEVSLTATDQYGCSDTSRLFIMPYFCNGLGVPNAFVPQGPNEINLFKPLAEGLKEYKLQIFSPYGELLWQTTELQNGKPAEGWDGTHRGKILPQDVYVWKIHGIFDDGTVWEGMAFDNEQASTMGSVTLLR